MKTPQFVLFFLIGLALLLASGCKPKIESADPAERLRAIRAPELTNQATLLAVALGDIDPAVAGAALEKLDAEADLARVALESKVAKLRLAAATKITNEGLLTKLALQAKDSPVRAIAVAKAVDQDTLAAVAMADAVSDLRDAAMRKLTNSAALNQVALGAQDRAIRVAAIRLISDQSALAKIANADADENVRRAAVEKLTDPAMIAQVVSKTMDPFIRGTAISNLSSQATLEQLAVSALDSKVRLEALNKLTNLAVVETVARQDTNAQLRMAAVDKLPEQQPTAGAATPPEKPTNYQPRTYYRLTQDFRNANSDEKLKSAMLESTNNQARRYPVVDSFYLEQEFSFGETPSWMYRPPYHELPFWLLYNRSQNPDQILFGGSTTVRTMSLNEARKFFGRAEVVEVLQEKAKVYTNEFVAVTLVGLDQARPRKNSGDLAIKWTLGRINALDGAKLPRSTTYMHYLTPFTNRVGQSTSADVYFQLVFALISKPRVDSFIGTNYTTPYSRDTLATIATEDQDSQVRLAAVAKLRDQKLLAAIAVGDEVSAVASAALQKITEPWPLAAVATITPNPLIRTGSMERLTDQAALTRVALREVDDPAQDPLSAIHKITDQSSLVRIALESEESTIREAAVGRKLLPPEVLADLVLKSAHEHVALQATRLLHDLRLLAHIAIKDRRSPVKAVAFTKLFQADRAQLANLASPRGDVLVQQAVELLTKARAAYTSVPNEYQPTFESHFVDLLVAFSDPLVAAAVGDFLLAAKTQPQSGQFYWRYSTGGTSPSFTVEWVNLSYQLRISNPARTRTRGFLMDWNAFHHVPKVPKGDSASSIIQLFSTAPPDLADLFKPVFSLLPQSALAKLVSNGADSRVRLAAYLNLKDKSLVAPYEAEMEALLPSIAKAKNHANDGGPGERNQGATLASSAASSNTQNRPDAANGSASQSLRRDSETLDEVGMSEIQALLSRAMAYRTNTPASDPKHATKEDAPSIAGTTWFLKNLREQKEVVRWYFHPDGHVLGNGNPEWPALNSWGLKWQQTGNTVEIKPSDGRSKLGSFLQGALSPDSNTLIIEGTKVQPSSVIGINSRRREEWVGAKLVW